MAKNFRKNKTRKMEKLGENEGTEKLTWTDIQKRERLFSAKYIETQIKQICWMIEERSSKIIWTLTSLKFPSVYL